MAWGPAPKGSHAATSFGVSTTLQDRKSLVLQSFRGPPSLLCSLFSLPSPNALPTLSSEFLEAEVGKGVCPQATCFRPRSPNCWGYGNTIVRHLQGTREKKTQGEKDVGDGLDSSSCRVHVTIASLSMSPSHKRSFSGRWGNLLEIQFYPMKSLSRNIQRGVSCSAVSTRNH